MAAMIVRNFISKFSAFLKQFLVIPSRFVCMHDPTSFNSFKSYGVEIWIVYANLELNLV